MTIADGVSANAAHFNSALLSRTADQTVTGTKTFSDDQKFSAAISVTRADIASSASIASMASTCGFNKVTGSTATALHGIVAGENGQILVLHNGASADVTLKYESATAGAAAQRIKTPDSLDMILGPSETVELIYDTNQSRWLIKSIGYVPARSIRTSFACGNAQASVSITGLILSSTVMRSAKVKIQTRRVSTGTIERVAYEEFLAIYNTTNGWNLTPLGASLNNTDSPADPAGVTFAINSSTGQFAYTSDSMSGSYDTALSKFTFEWEAFA